jgi:hypothetical protein
VCGHILGWKLGSSFILVVKVAAMADDEVSLMDLFLRGLKLITFYNMPLKFRYNGK